MSSIENQLCSCTNLAHGHDTQSLQAECNTKTHVLSSGLGAVLGLVVVALAVVTFGWVWTCWTMRKKEGIKVKSEENRR